MRDLPTHLDGIVYDTALCQYYNKSSDIYLDDEDVSILKLRPLSQIPRPLPENIDKDYFRG